MSQPILEIVVHGPPGSAPPVLAEALRAAAREVRPVSGDLWRLTDRSADPGIDAMELLFGRAGEPRLVSTCTPVFLQAPLLRGLGPLHRKLTPIARLVSDRFLVVVRADAAIPDGAAFLDDIVRRRTRTAGYFLGGINHLLALAVGEATGATVDFAVVASEPEVWRGLAAGAIDWGCGVTAEILPHVAAGHLRPIAALADRRNPAFPDLPTLAELGTPIDFELWRGLVAPPGLSMPDRQHLIATVDGLRASNAWQSYLNTNAQTDDFLPGDAFATFLDQQWDWYARHLGAAGLLPGQVKGTARS